jgi:anti-anti-sigma factor
VQRAMIQPGPDDAFTIERHGEIYIIAGSPNLERMEVGHVEGAATLVLNPIREASYALVLIDLSRVDSFGSPVLAILIRCWKLVSEKGGTMVLAGASPDVRKLLKITKFDTLWAIYDTRGEAMRALLDD